MEIQLWREILEPYSLAVDELVVKFNHLINAQRISGNYSNIERVDGRVKKISSILEKCQKKGIDLDNFESTIEDIAGIRITCQFVEDIYQVVNIIKNRSDMRVKSEDDYIKERKASGYRSYHMVVYYKVDAATGPKELLVEIQIRTLAMNFWATIEHSLQYKYKKEMPSDVRERLLRAADVIEELDDEMGAVRDDIMDAQNSFNRKARLVSDILNNIQNLYKVANKREVIKIQDEFFRIYSTGDINQISRFSKDLDVITEGFRAQSLN